MCYARGMIAAIALLALLPQQQGYFRQVVKAPTGKNGFEEMVMAGDLLRQGRFGTYMRLSEVQAGQVEEAKMDPAEQAIWSEFRGLTLLQRRRVIVRKFQPVLDLLDAAAKKDIYDPRKDMDFNTLLPEQSGFKEVAKLLPIAAYVGFADGQGQRSIQILTQGFDVFDRLSHGLLIQYLVGVASANILIVSVEEHLPRMSLRDAVQLEETVAEILQREPAVRSAMQIEMAVVPPIIKRTLIEMKEEDLEALIGFAEGPDRERGIRALKGLATGDRQRVLDGVLERFGQLSKDVQTLFSADEAAWAGYKPLDPPRPDWSNPNAIADSVLTNLTPSYEQVGRAAAVSRTRLRLLGLACGVVRYRWEHGQLPTRLEDAVGPALAHDPLSKQPFDLRKDGPGFAIFSRGTKETGEIGLRYKRPDGGTIDP